MNSSNDFFFPLSDESCIKFPSDLTAQFSHLSFGVSSVWTLPFSHNDSQFFLTFLISKIFVWNSDKKICSFQIDGNVKKNRAILVKNIVGESHCLYFVLNNDCLYCLPNVLDKNCKISEIKLGKKVSYITLSQDHYNGIILTTDQFIYFVNSDGTYSNNHNYHLSNKLSFIKDFGNDNYIGCFQNIIYQLNHKFQHNQTIILDDYSRFQDIYGEMNSAIFIGCSKNGKLLLSSLNITGDDESYQKDPITAGVDYDSFHVLQIDADLNQPSYALVSKSHISLLNKEMKIIGKLPISKPDYLISSFVQKVNNSYKLFVHLAKSGLHSYIPFDDQFQLTEKNIHEYIFYSVYLFSRAQDNKGKREIAASFLMKYQQFINDDDLGRNLSKSERDLFIARKSSLSYEQVITFHDFFIQMIEISDNSNQIVPFLNTNAIYLNLIRNCSEDDNLYRYSSFEKLNKLLDSLSKDSSTILLKSIREAIEFTSGNSRAVFGGYEHIFDIINNLLQEIPNNSKITLNLIESKLLLTGLFDSEDIDEEQLQSDTDDYERFALKYKIIEILYEIILSTLDFKRAIKYAEILNQSQIDIRLLYNMFQFYPDIQRKLALLRGWENADSFVSFKEGIIVQEQRNEDKYTFSGSSLLHLCESLVHESEEVKNAIKQLNITSDDFKPM